MRKTKKTLAILAIVAMVVALLPVQVFAADSSALPARLSGNTQYDTAATIAQQWTAPTKAVLAPGEKANLVDALAAGPLAAALDAPILLTDGNTLTDATLTALGTTVKDVYVVSGTAVIKQAVLDKLTQKGITLHNVYGAEAPDTSVAIAQEIAKTGAITQVALANGKVGAQDAMSIASFAGAAKMPILVTDNANTLPASVSAYLASLTGVTKKYVVGGTAVISDAEKAAFGTADRLAGATAYDTNDAVIKALATTFDNVFVANGETLVDALAGAPLAAKKNAAIVLTDGTNATAATYVNTKLGATSVVTALGGEKVVPAAVAAKVVYTAPPAPAALAVSSVAALDLNQFKVTFTQPVDKTTAETTTNYIIDGVALTGADKAALQSDKKTVLVTTDVPLTQYQTVQFETVKNGILSKDLLSGVPKFSGSVTASDTTIPTITSVDADGNSGIAVAFSEPVKMPALGLLNTAGSLFKLDGQNLTNYGYTSPATVSPDATTLNEYSSEIDFAFAVPLAAGSHTLTIPDGTATYLTDAAGFMVTSKAVTFTVDSVTTAPQVSTVTGNDNGTVYVTYSRAMGDSATDETLYTVNGTAATAASFVSGTGSTQVKLTFPADTVAVGANVLVISADVEDQYGNAVGDDDVRITFTGTDDTTKPTVSSVTVMSNTTIRVKFSETVNYVYAENAANYSVKDADGVSVAIAGVAAVPTANQNSDTYTVTLGAGLTGANYTLKIKNIPDLAATPNTMDAFTTTIVGSDSTAPNVTTAVQVDGSNTKVAVLFDEAMDPATLTTAANYAYVDNQASPATHALPSSATVTAGDGNKSVLITFPSSYTVNGGAATAYSVIKIRVSNVKDAAGNILDGIVQTPASIAAANVAVLGNPALVSKSLTLSSDSTKVTAKFSFTQAIATLDITDFLVAGVAADSGYVSGKDVILNFTNTANQATIRAAGVGAKLSDNSENSANSYGIPIAAFADETVYNDNLAPKILKVAGVPQIFATKGAANKVTIQFSEAIDATILGLYADDFQFIQSGKVLSVTTVTAAAADTLQFNFAASTIVAGDVLVKAASTVDIRALEDAAGNQGAYAPSTTDKTGYTVTAP